jgi:hypothetical protein
MAKSKGHVSEQQALETVDMIAVLGLPSPSCHIYNPLTIAVAFRRPGAFDRVWQHPIKVDQTFA